MAKPGKHTFPTTAAVHPPREFPLCDAWAKEILAPWRREKSIVVWGNADQLEQAIYEALVEACQRGTPLAFD
jgi:hypothetical protein